mmetsp:Transcript_4852/g.9859  ORF Transcript_4852/g.9859 Transcript_4852/m.9859 type:complete len:118 (-) Transcript_4852:69-422(-)
MPNKRSKKASITQVYFFEELRNVAGKRTANSWLEQEFGKQHERSRSCERMSPLGSGRRGSHSPMTPTRSSSFSHTQHQIPTSISMAAMERRLALMANNEQKGLLFTDAAHLLDDGHS